MCSEENGGELGGESKEESLPERLRRVGMGGCWKCSGEFDR